jgi:hypothetical protein
MGMSLGIGPEYGKLNHELLYQRQHWILFESIRIFSVLSILCLYPLKHSKESSMIIGGWALMYFFSLPAQYYFVIILPISIALINEKETHTRNIFLWSIAAATLLGNKNLPLGLDTYIISIIIGVGILTISLHSIPKIGRIAQWAIIPLLLISAYQIDWKEPHKKGYIKAQKETIEFPITAARLDEKGRNYKSNIIQVDHKYNADIKFDESVNQILLFADLPANGELEINTDYESFILNLPGRTNVLKEYEISLKKDTQEVSISWNHPEGHPLLIFETFGLNKK